MPRTFAPVDDMMGPSHDERMTQRSGFLSHPDGGAGTNGTDSRGRPPWQLMPQAHEDHWGCVLN
jgi:hypothetical protein